MLLLHKYGNYFLKALISNSSAAQRLIVLKAMESVFLDASYSVYGIHPIQALLGCQLIPEEEEIIRSILKGTLVKLSLHENGSYIAQKVMCLVKDHKDQIFEEVIPHVIFLSKTEKGLNVVKKLVSSLKCKVAQSMIISKIKEDSTDYIENFYSNYVIQLILQCWPMESIQDLFPLICGRIKEFSLQKSSSNVIETMICYSPPEIRRKYFEEIASLPDLYIILQSGFGNYVMQKALEVSQGDDRKLLLSTFELNIEKIKEAKIKGKWRKIVQSYN